MGDGRSPTNATGSDEPDSVLWPAVIRFVVERPTIYAHGRIVIVQHAHSAAHSLQVSPRFFEADNIGETRLDVEQGPFVSDLRAIFDRLADDDRTQTETLGVGRRRPHTRARRAAG